MLFRSQLRISMWFLAALALLIVNAAYIYKNFKQFDSQKNLVTHTYEVINTLEEVVSSLKDVQAAQRGYVITGQLNYLTPYTEAIPNIETLLNQLETLLADNPQQREHLATLRGEVSQRLVTAASVINAYQSEGQDAAFALIRLGTGNHEMNVIRAHAANMVQIEKDLLNMRQYHVDRFSSITLWLGGSGLLLCIGILWLVFVFMQRDNHRREVAEETLQAANAEMRKNAQQDNLISQMTNYLQGCGTITETHEILQRFMPQLLPDTSGSIYAYDSGRMQLETEISWGDSPSSNSFGAHDCWAMRRGQPHMASSDTAEPVCAHIMPGRATSACIPLQARGGIEGLFFVASASQDMDDRVTQFAHRIGEQVSLALTNIRLQDSLRLQSISDPLTGLYNRRHLEDAMVRELSRAKRNTLDISLLVLDIDHFKKYNDLRGHDAGDALLKQFAETLRLHTRREDIICRYGGEEFVVVLPGTPVESALKYADIIRRATSSMAVAYKGQSFDGVTVSIGIAAYPRHGASLDELVTAADTALYRAKHNGRDRVEIAEIPA